MTIITGRAKEAAKVSIDRATCTHCGACARVCAGVPLFFRDGAVQIDPERYFGCVGCGQCLTVCPTGAIKVEGRDLSPADVLPLPPREARAGYEALSALLLARRSTRIFADRPVERSEVEQILEAASMAPMGLPPTDVGVLVLHGPERVAALSNDLLAYVKQYRAWLKPGVFALFRPFMSRETYESVSSFMLPAMRLFLEKQEEGEDWLLYGAPLGLYFYGSAYSDPADASIAATYAMLAGETLGLGTCMIGTVGYFFQYSQALRRKYALPNKISPGLMVLFGHPAVARQHALRRRFAKVGWA